MTGGDALTIAAIVPLYQGGRHIEEALRSVLAQEPRPDEVIVVDDGSTDDGPDRVRRLAAAEPSIRLLHQTNAGQSSARNHGVRASGSTLLAFLDQDDTWYPGHLARLSEPFRGPPGDTPLGWTYSDLDIVDGSGAPRTRSLLSLSPIEHPKRTLAGCLRHDMHVLPSAALVSRTAFDSVGGFDERLAGYEDDDLFLRIFLAGYGNVFVNEALSTWRKHDGSASFSPRMARSRQIYVETLARVLPSLGPEGAAAFRDVAAPRFFRNLLVRHALALRDGDHDALRQTRVDLRQLRPYLSGRAALLAGALGAAMVATASAAGARVVGRIVRPLVDRLARRHALVAPSRSQASGPS